MTDTFLLNDFYTIEKTERKNSAAVLATIHLNQSHPIFKGHFEQMPVVPGVCQTQIIKELLQQQINKNLILTKGSNIKFTAMIVPTEHTTINVEYLFEQKEDAFVVDAKLFQGDITFTKFKGTFATI